MLKTSKVVGWTHSAVAPHSLHHHHSNHHQAAPAVDINTWNITNNCNNYPVTPTNNTAVSSHNNVTPKDAAMSTSLDSGVAGLRDTPVHIPNHLTTATTTTTTSPAAAATVAIQQQQGTVTINNNMPGPKPVSPTDEHDVPKFIVDQTTRTTYMKGRFLGKGGFARVHELTDLTTNVTYAGKIIPKSRITKPHHKEKIAREIEVHRHLHHPNVVRFHRYFEDDSNVYIILENCSMRSLVHVVRYRTTLTEPEVRYYLRQLAEGVAFIHGEGIIHRDLKLGNMFLSQDMEVKIGDFGLATRASDTKQITICGTPNYIAPEVLNKYGHFYQADIWAMGCIMYALLVGQPPFETETLKETYSRITNNQYVIPPLVSTAGRALIKDLLHPDPKCRPSVQELLKHDFFTKAFIPRSLPTLACTQVPSFGKAVAEQIGKPLSVPEHQQSQVLSSDIRKITTSVSTLRLPNAKPQHDKISILTDNLGQVIPTTTNNRINNQLLNNNNNISPSSLQSSQQQLLLQRHNQHNSQQQNGGGSSPPSQLEHHLQQQQQLPQSTVITQAKDASNRRKDTLGANGLRLFEKITSAIYTPDGGKNCLGGLVGGKKREMTSGTLYNLLAACLDSMPDVCNGSAACQSFSPVFISKWIDYSNKYGFGYQLSDGSVGVFFNDLTRINISADKSRLEHHDCSGRLTSVSPSTLPAWLQKQYQLLRYFACYMDENLTEAGDAGSSLSSSSRCSNSSSNSSNSKGSSSSSNNSSSSGHQQQLIMPHIRRWDRTAKSIIMQLSNGTFQINFLSDHTKIVVSGERSNDESCILYINSDRVSSTYRLMDVANSGCDAAIRERLVYALSCLRQYAELDGEEV